MASARRNHPNSIVRLRGAAGWSLHDLARVSRIDEWTIRQLEVGKVQMHMGHKRRFMDVFNVTEDDLLKPCRSRRNPQISRARSLRNLDRGRGAARWAGKLKIPEKAHPLVRELFEIMNQHQLLIDDVVNGSGVKRAAVSEWRHRRSPSLTSFEAVLSNMGYKLVIEEDIEPDG